ncbi:MAG: bifunctional phosphoglucose/phosphomannose isomerase, partial [Candidatus Bathyarchaeota archaeon]
MSDVFLHPLDSTKKIKTMNSVKFWRDFPEQCEDALRRAQKLEIPKKLQISSKLVLDYGKPSEVLVVGVGGSAIGGDILKDWTSETLDVPLEVCRDYHLPHYAGVESLVIAVSYSGNTEETLSSFIDAVKRGCKVIAVTSGGVLGKLCNGFKIPMVELPGGMVPRSAIGYLFFPLVMILEKFDLIGDVEEDIKETMMILREVRDEILPEISITANRSKQLAAALFGSIPVIYGDRYSRAIAYRSRTQMNENSKLLAISGFLSEIDHNDVLGWEAPEEYSKQFSVVLLRTGDDMEELRYRAEITRDLVAEKARRLVEVFPKGESRLTKMLSVMYVVDVASLYLAIMNEVDPWSMRSITELKSRLSKQTKTMDSIKKEAEDLL